MIETLFLKIHTYKLFELVRNYASTYLSLWQNSIICIVFAVCHLAFPQITYPKANPLPPTFHIRRGRSREILSPKRTHSYDLNSSKHALVANKHMAVAWFEFLHHKGHITQENSDSLTISQIYQPVLVCSN